MMEVNDRIEKCMAQKVKIGFRADANEHIASGHIMRCMSIAAQCRRLGAECIFILAQEKETAGIISSNFEYVVLGSDWSCLDTELDIMKKMVSDLRLDFLVVDSYQAGSGYLEALQSTVPVLYIDDIAADTYDITAVLHYGVGDNADYYLQYGDYSNTDILAGSEYIPLREEFITGEHGTDYRHVRDKSIMITTGCTDPFDVTRQLLNAFLQEPVFGDYSFEVIVGGMNQYAGGIDSMAVECDRIHTHYNVNNMSYYMRRCMAAVSAGGTTLFELCACGTPAVCFSFAENQVDGAKRLDSMGVIRYAGDAREHDVVPAILGNVKNLLENDDIYKKCSHDMRQCVDGRGAVRIASYILEFCR